MTTPAQTALEDQIHAANNRAHRLVRDLDGRTWPEQAGPIGRAIVTRMIDAVTLLILEPDNRDHVHTCPHLHTTGVDIAYWIDRLPGVWICQACHRWLRTLHGRPHACAWCDDPLPYGPPPSTWLHLATRLEWTDPTRPDRLMPSLVIELHLCPSCHERNQDN